MRNAHFNKFFVLVMIFLSEQALASPIKDPYSDPIAPVILGVTGILFFAVLGRFIARKLKQPTVMGELIMGVLMGNVGYYLGLELVQVLREGSAIFDIVEQVMQGRPLGQAAESIVGKDSASRLLLILQGQGGMALMQVAHVVDVFSRYGVIFLLFLVGLDTSVKEMREVGADSLRVALIGVLLPIIFGFMAARVLMPEVSLNTALFVAATLGATSVGISARVLRDLDQVRSREAHVILGAAVIDDILGLIMLAIISGIVVSGSVELGNILTTILLAALFLIVAFYFGPVFLRYVIRFLRHLDLAEAKMFISFLFVMVLAWLANFVGLATIVGAFAAGVVLNDAYFHHWNDRQGYQYSIRELIMPLEAILVPLFFVLMGMQVKMETFLDQHVIQMAFVLIVAAIAGKLFAGLGASKAGNRFAIGIGMMPRGEVGLIFASIGKSLGVINDALFSSIVLMVVVTSVATPPLLKLSMKKVA